MMLALLATSPALLSARPVQLCACDAASAATQAWTWGAPGAGSGGGMATALSRVRLKSDPSLCLVVGSGAEPMYLSVDACNASSVGAPLELSFRAQHNAGLVRDTAVLTDGAQSKPRCMDAAGMSQHLQLWECIADDDDQQYEAVEGYGLIVDLWTGFGNCVGLAGDGCAPPTGARQLPAPGPPAPASQPSTRMSPRYHLNDGGHRQSDPSGCIEINGTWFVFPDGSGGPQGGSVYTSPDLVHWTRRPTNIRFGETGGIGVTDAGVAVTFGGGYHFTDLKSDPYMSHWSGADLGQGDPHSAHGMGPKNVFRNGDPARPFKFKGDWYIVLGAGKNASTASAPAILDCPLCNNPWMQGELRLYKATNSTLSDWHFVNTIYATNQTAGRTLHNDNTWASEMRDCPTCPMHSISNMFECP